MKEKAFNWSDEDYATELEQRNMKNPKSGNQQELPPKIKKQKYKKQPIPAKKENP